MAYVDGTTYYLARTDAEADDKERLQLGRYVWRDAAGKDGIFTDCVGPSLYAAKQGRPVKVWGLLLNGHICSTILCPDLLAWPRGLSISPSLSFTP